jgi:hypothetical protein
MQYTFDGSIMFMELLNSIFKLKFQDEHTNYIKNEQISYLKLIIDVPLYLINIRLTQNLII